MHVKANANALPWAVDCYPHCKMVGHLSRVLTQCRMLFISRHLEKL